MLRWARFKGVSKFQEIGGKILLPICWSAVSFDSLLAPLSSSLLVNMN